MANEVLLSGIGDLTTAANLAAQYMLELADRDGSALSHPALAYVGAATPGSNVIQTPFVGLGGYDLLASGTEGTDPGNTALTDSSASVTVALYDKIYTIGDLARFVDAYGIFDVEAMAADMLTTVGQTLIDLIMALAVNFTTNVAGTSGVDLVVQDHTDAITLLEIQKVQTELAAIYAPRQWGDLRTDSLSLGGAVQHRADAQGIVNYTRGAYKGQLFGVDCFVSSHADTSDSGANTNGLMFGRGAVLWGDGLFAPEGMDSNIIDLAIPGAPVRGRLERARDGRKGETAWVQRALLGVVEGKDAAGCRMRSDA